MPRYAPRGTVEAHRTDAGDDYLLLDDRGGFIGVLDSHLFDRVFQLEKDIGAMAGDVLSGARRIEDVLAELRPTVAAGIRAVVDGRPLPEGAPPGRCGEERRAGPDRREQLPALQPEDLVPASERMQQAIAARTESGGPGAAPLPRSQEAVDAAIEETRKQVDREVLERSGAGVDNGGFRVSGGGIPYGTKLQPGETAGRGRKVCTREGCNTVNPLTAKKCLGCGKAVKVARR